MKRIRSGSGCWSQEGNMSSVHFNHGFERNVMLLQVPNLLIMTRIITILSHCTLKSPIIITGNHLGHQSVSASACLEVESDNGNWKELVNRQLDSFFSLLKEGRWWWGQDSESIEGLNHKHFVQTNVILLFEPEKMCAGLSMSNCVPVHDDSKLLF